MPTRLLIRTICLWAALHSCGALTELRAEQPLSLGLVSAKTRLQHEPRLRRPLAIARTNQAGVPATILVANRIGSVSLIDANSKRLVNEVQISRQLDDLLTIPGTDRLLAVDSAAHHLVQARVELYSAGIASITNIRRVKLPNYPVDIVLSKDKQRAIVTSLWSRRVSVIDVSRKVPRLLQTCDVPFCPRSQCILDERNCLVADAFGGKLAVVDFRAGVVRSVFEINGHNIRGMSLDADGQAVVLTHQILHGISSTTRSIISWGGVISNTLHTITLDALLKNIATGSTKSQTIHGALYPLGEERNAAGDPSNLAIDSQGRTFVALAGVHQIARKDAKKFELARTSVGRHPCSLLLDEKARQLYIANKFDDSISIVSTESLRIEKTISLGKVATRSLVQTGEEHFYDARLSLDSWYSCHSCHTDGHTTGLLNDNFGDSTFNTPKSILTLLGTGATEPWAWEANQIDLRNQIRSSISSTMGGPGTHTPKVNDRLIESMNSFIGQLQPAPGILKARGEANRASVKRGKKVFMKHGCYDCHRPPNYAHPLTFDVGIHDEAGHKYFNPPSLLGVSQRGPYFHDNRAKSLRDVIENHDHDGASALEQNQINDLIDFLRSL
jgi:DNA-binding beta-propeller fold protein YncE